MTTAAVAFDDFFTPETLRLTFDAKLARRAGRGIDGVSMDSFGDRLETELSAIAERCSGGRYLLAPYLQRLVSKSHNELPRSLSIGTARDRLVLSQLHEYLRTAAPPSREQRLAHQHIRSLISDTTFESTSLWVLRADIKSFFPSIDQRRVQEMVAARGVDPRALELLRRALRNPTTPHATARQKRRRFILNGVPQGIPFANYLANIYLSSFDSVVAPPLALYDRYVDDLLLVGDGDSDAGRRRLVDELAVLSLKLNPEKSPTAKSISEPFDFLGYELTLSSGSARASRRNCTLLVRSIAAIIARHDRHLYVGIPPEELAALRIAAQEELNERITGARWGARSFGWMFYFSEVRDIKQLHVLDAAIARVVARSALFSQSPCPLKSLVRTYYEIRARTNTGYIMDYNAIRTPDARRTLLIARKQVSAARAYLLIDEEIDRIFAAHVEQRLSRVERDEGLQYN